MKLIKTLSSSITEILTATTNSITPLFRSVQNGAEALEIYSQEFKLDAEFDSRKAQAERSKELAEFEATLLSMEIPTN